MPYERENIQRLAAYTPGEQPAAVGVDGQVKRVIKLNTNENPYPPIEPVMQAIRTLPGESLRRYPSPSAMTFRKTAAQVHSAASGVALTAGNIIATNGGDELLRLAITVFCEPVPNSPPSQGGAGGGLDARQLEAAGFRNASDIGAIRNDDRPTLPQPLPKREGSPTASTPTVSPRRGIGVAEPSYSLYPVLAETHDTPTVRVDLTADYDIPGDFEDRMLTAGVGLVLIVNPHAPSGRLYPVERLERMARKLMGHAVLLIDEAYVDFAQRDCLPLLAEKAGLDNVLLLRSMSKGYSLAGLRFGYGIGHANLIAAMDKARDSYNTDALAQAAATAAVANRSLAAESWKKVIAERTRMTAELTKRGWRVFPSQSNFLLAVPPANATAGPPSRQGGAFKSAGLKQAPPCRDGAPAHLQPPLAKQIYESLKARDILVRYFDLDGLRDKLRITIGTPEENTAVLEALDQSESQS